MNKFLFVSFLACAAAADMPMKEEAELDRAKINYKTQMQYQGDYPKEAADLKKEYKAQVARIKSKFNSTKPETVMLLATSDSMKMKAAIRKAKEDYSTQMEYMGQYPKEAAELKHQYEKKVAHIKSEYASKGSPLMLFSESACGDEEKDLQEALNNYKMQKSFQGAYPDEAEKLKQEYATQVRHIKSLYASKECGATNMMLLAAPSCGEEEGDLQDAKQDYKIQMGFQGAFPEEAEELKQEYAAKVMKIKKQYATCHSGDAAALGLTADSGPTAGVNLLVIGMAAIFGFLSAVFVFMLVRKTGVHSTPLLG